MTINEQGYKAWIAKIKEGEKASNLIQKANWKYRDKNRGTLQLSK